MKVLQKVRGHKITPGWRRCAKCPDGYLHGVSDDERDAVKTAFKLGGVVAVLAMYPEAIA